MADPTTTAGFNTVVAAGTTVLAVETVDFTIEVDVDDTTTTASASAGKCDQRLLPQVRRGTVALSTVYDFSAGYFDPPLSLIPGNTVAVFHVKPDGNLDFNFPALVVSARWRGGTKANTVRIDFNLRSTGNMNIP